MPPPPIGQGRLDINDCDGEGPGTVICVAEDSLVRIAEHMKRQSMWINLAATCPGMKIELNATPRVNVGPIADPTGA